MRRLRVMVWWWAASFGSLGSARAAVPTISQNNSIPGTAELEKLAGGLMTLGLIGGALGFFISLGGLGIAGHSHNVHLRDRFKTGAGISLIGTVAFGAANRLLAWAWNIGAGF